MGELMRHKTRVTAFCMALLMAGAASANAYTLGGQAEVFAARNAGSKVVGPITVTLAVTDTLQAGSELWINIPSQLGLNWAAADGVQVAGGAFGTPRVDGTGRSLVLPVSEVLAGEVALEITGARVEVTALAAVSSQPLTLSIGGATPEVATGENGWGIGLPGISLVGRRYVVGDDVQPLGDVTVSEGNISPSMALGDTLRLVLPEGLAWDTGASVTVSESSSGRLSSPVYSADGLEAAFAVTGNFTVDASVVISGLEVGGFEQVLAASPLVLSLNAERFENTRAEAALQIGLPQVEVGEHVFVMGDGARALGPVRIVEDGLAAGLDVDREVRLQLPAGMVWDAGVTSVSVTAVGSGRLTGNVSYLSGNGVAVLQVSAAFGPGDAVSIAGLSATGFSSVVAPSPLVLQLDGRTAVVGQSGDSLRVGSPGVELSSSQVFTVLDPSTELVEVVIGEAAQAAGITATAGLRLVLPAGLALEWDPASATATGGSAADKVSSVVVEDSRVVLVSVEEDFAAGDTLRLSGLRVHGFTTESTPATLSLQASEPGVINATTTNTLGIGLPEISLEPRRYVVGDDARPLGDVTVSEGSVSPSMALGDTLWLVLPEGLAWDAGASVRASISGSGGLSSSPVYSADGQVAAFAVTGNFAANASVVISGLQVGEFERVLAASALGLSLNEELLENTRAEAVLQVGLPRVELGEHVFVVGDRSRALGPVRIVEDDLAAGLDVGREVRLQLPAGMVWDAGVTSVSVAVVGSGGLSGSVSYTAGNSVAALQVTGAFDPGDAVSIAGLSATGFSTAVAPAALAMQLDARAEPVGQSGDSLRVGNPDVELSSSQVFTVLDPSTELVEVVIWEAAEAAGITASAGLRLVLPSGLALEWGSASGAVAGGSAADKLSSVAVLDSRVVLVSVAEDFAAGDTLRLSGLQVQGFSAESTPAALEVQASGLGVTNATTTNTLGIGRITITSPRNQSFVLRHGFADLASVAIGTRGTVASLTEGKVVRLLVPGGGAVSWDTTVPPTLTTSGGAVSFLGSSDTSLALTIDESLSPTDSLVVSGLRLSLNGPLHQEPLRLSANASQLVNATDPTWIQVGQPEISLTRDLVYDAREVTGSLDTITISELAEAGSITARSGIRLRLGDGLIQWGSQEGALTIALPAASRSGSAGAKVASTASVSDNGKVLNITVSDDFAKGDTLRLTGLPVWFEGLYPEAALSLQASDNEVDALTTWTIRVGQPSITFDRTALSVRDTVLAAVVEGDATQSLPVISVRESFVPVTNQKDALVLALPVGLDLTWDVRTGDQVLFSGSQGTAAKVESVESDDYSGRTLTIRVSEDFAGGDSLAVEGLGVTIGQAASRRDCVRVALVGERFSKGVLPLSVGAPTLTSRGDQSFVALRDTVGDVSEIALPMVIQESNLAPGMVEGDTVQIIIPDTLAMEWDAASADAITVAGASSDWPTPRALIDAADPKRLLIPVQENIAAGRSLEVLGARLTGFGAASVQGALRLSVTGGRAINALDGSSKRVGAPSLSSGAFQRLIVDAPYRDLLPVTLTESPVEGCVDSLFTITLPAELASVTAFDDNASVRVEPVGLFESLEYLVGNTSARVRLRRPLVAGEVVAVSGLRLTELTQKVSAARLELSVNGGLDAVDEQSKRVSGRPTIALQGDVALVANDLPTRLEITIRDDDEVPAILSAEGLRLYLPGALPAQWDSVEVDASLGQGGLVAAVAVVAPDTILIELTSDLPTGGLLEVRAWLANMRDAAGGEPIYLSATANTAWHQEQSVETIRIGRPRIRSYQRQVFIAGRDGDTTRTYLVAAADTDTVEVSAIPKCAPFHIYEDELASAITPSHPVRIRIPAGMQGALEWDSTSVVTIGGPEAAKVDRDRIGWSDDLTTVELYPLEPFAPGDSIVVSGLLLQGFGSTATPAGLELYVSGQDIQANDSDDSTKAVGRPQVRLGASAQEQRFLVSEDSVLAPPIIITEDALAAVIGRDRGIRLELQEGFEWAATGDAEISGTVQAAGVGLDIDATHREFLKVSVPSDFAPGDSLVIACLRYAPPSGEARVPTFLHLQTGGPGDEDSDAEISQAAVVGSLAVDASEPELFWTGDVPRSIAPITIRSGNQSILRAGDTLRIDLPEEFQATWVVNGQAVGFRRPQEDVADSVAWPSGAVELAPEGVLAAAFLEKPPAFNGVGSSLALILASAPDSGQVLEIGNLWLGDFGVSGSAALEFTVGLANSEVVCGEPDRRFLVEGHDMVVASLAVESLTELAAQTFLAGTPGIQALKSLQVSTDHAGGFPEGSTAYIYLPKGFGATWVGGDGPGGSVAVDLPFEATTVTIEELAIRGGATVSGSDNLEVSLAMSDMSTETLAVLAEDSRQIRIGAPKLALRDSVDSGEGRPADMVFIAADALAPGAEIRRQSAPLYDLVVTEDPVAAALNTGDTVKISIPRPFSAKWHDGYQPRITGSAAGKVSIVGFTDSVRVTDADDDTLLFRVDTPLSAGDSLVIAGLQLTRIEAASPRTSLKISLRGYYEHESLETMRIGRPAMTSADQVFVVGQDSADVVPFILVESGAGTITAARDLRLVIRAAPQGPPVRWVSDSAHAVSAEVKGSGRAGAVTFSPTRDTCIVDILDDLAAGDSLIVGVAGGPLWLTDFVDRGKGSILAVITDAEHAIADANMIYVGAPEIRSVSEQAFVRGDSATPLAPFYIIEDPEVSTLRTDGRVAIVLPDFLEWDVDPEVRSLGPAVVSLLGVRGTRRDTLLLALQDTVAEGDSIAVWGPRVNVTGLSKRQSLGLSVSTSGHVHTRDDSGKWAGSPSVSLDRDVALAVDSTESVDASFLVTIGDPNAGSGTPIALPGDVILRFTEEYLHHVVWDSISAKVGTTPASVATYADTVEIGLDSRARAALRTGDQLTVRAYRLRLSPGAYESLSVLRQGDVAGHLQMGVHGRGNASYTVRISGRDTTVTLENPRKRVFIETDEAREVRAFTPTIFGTPVAYTNRADTTSWLAFQTARDSVRLANATGVLVQVYASEQRNDSLFAEASSLSGRALPRQLDTVRVAGVDVPVTWAGIRLGRPGDPALLRSLNRWYDDQSQGGPQVETVLRSDLEYLDDAEQSHVRRIEFRGTPQPGEAIFPLAARYVNTGSAAGTANLLEISGVGTLRLVVNGRSGWDAVSESGGTSITGDSLEDGLHELWFYGEAGEATHTVPAIRQVVIDREEPLIATAVDGIPDSNRVSDLLTPPGEVAARVDTNVLRPQPGLSADGRGLTVSGVDVLRTRISDNLLVRQAPGAGGVRVVEYLDGSRTPPDTLHFRFPDTTFTTTLELMAIHPDSGTVAVGTGSLTSAWLDSVREAMAMGDPTLANADIDTAVTAPGKVSLSIPLTFVGPQDSITNLVFPIALLPGALKQDGVELWVRLVATDLADNSAEYVIGVDATRYNLSLPTSGEALVGKLINYPNPFRTLPGSGSQGGVGTTLRFTLGDPADVTLRVFDVLGDQVYVARMGGLPAGENLITWPGRDLYNNPLASGVYFGVLEVSGGGPSATKKVIMAVLNHGTRGAE